MRIGSSIFLIALGAILAWAIAPGLIPFVDQALVGYILMAVGVIGRIASLVLASPGRTRRMSSVAPDSSTSGACPPPAATSKDPTCEATVAAEARGARAGRSALLTARTYRVLLREA